MKHSRLKALRLLRGLGVCLGPFFLWGYKYVDLVINVGETRIWDSKIWSWVPRDFYQRVTVLAKVSYIINDSQVITSNCSTATQILAWVPDGGLTPRHTGRLTVGRNTTLTSTLNAGQSPVGKNMSMEAENNVGNRHKATTEDTADWQELVLAVANRRVSISETAIVTCSYNLQVFNESN
jgi:hypothetical protein